MKNNLSNSKYKFLGIIIGLSLLIMTLVAMFSYGYAHRTIINVSNPLKTYENLISMKNLFIYEIIGWIIIAILDFLLSYCLCKISSLINPKKGKIVGITRLLYSIFLTFAISKLIYLSQTIDIRTAYSAITLIEKFNSIWSFGLIIFGCHLIALGLTFKATKLPRIISILLVIGGVGYIIVETLHIIIPSYSNIVGLINMLFMIPMTFGELGFGVWLFVKSNKLKSLFGAS